MRFTILFWILLLMGQYSYGADENQSWTKFSFEKKLPHAFKLEFSQGLRLKDKFSTFNLSFFEMALSYKDSSGLKINIPYRYTIFEDKIKHRVSLGVSYQDSFKSINLKSRIKYYRLYEEGESSTVNEIAFGDLIRSKLTIKYKTQKKINPYISGELFHLFSTGSNPFDEYRASFGIVIDLPRKSSINLFYTYKKEGIANSDINAINVIGLSYISKLSKGKSK